MSEEIVKRLNAEVNLGIPNARWEEVTRHGEQYYRISPLSESVIKILNYTTGYSLRPRHRNEYLLDADTVHTLLNDPERYRIGFDTIGDRLIADVRLYELLTNAVGVSPILGAGDSLQADRSASQKLHLSNPLLPTSYGNYWITLVAGPRDDQETHFAGIQKIVNCLESIGLTPDLKKQFVGTDSRWRQSVAVSTASLQEWINRTRETGAEPHQPGPQAAAVGPRTPTQQRPPIEPGSKGGGPSM